MLAHTHASPKASTGNVVARLGKLLCHRHHRTNVLKVAAMDLLHDDIESRMTEERVLSFGEL